MYYCRICTQHYISCHILKHETGHRVYIAITSEINPCNLPQSHISGYDFSIQPLLPCYKSPQKSSLHVVTVRNGNELIDQKISIQHDQE
jgi:hypothetical protein